MTTEERKQYDIEIERFKEITKYMLSTIFLADLEGKVIFANEMAVRRTFLSDSPDRERKYHEIWNRLTPQEYKDQMIKIATIDQLPFSADFNNRVINEQHNFQQFNLTPILDNDPNLKPPDNVLILVVIIPEIRDKFMQEEFKMKVMFDLGDQDSEPDPVKSMQTLNEIVITYLKDKEQSWDFKELDEDERGDPRVKDPYYKGKELWR